VTLAQVTRPAVLAAIDEFDRLGRDEFLQSIGFGRARSYYLAFNGRLYDSKALVGYAHGVSTGVALKPADFTGGDKTVAQRLRALGFNIEFLRNPDWTRDEIILACALVESNGWKQLDRTDPRVMELSDLLQTPAIIPVNRRGPEFRNDAGVARKTADIATRHPSYPGVPTNGGRLDREVLKEFLADPDEMRATAAAIRAALASGEAVDAVDTDQDLSDPSVAEGGVLLRLHLRRERDRRIRQAKIADAVRRGIRIACEVCGFDFGETYGPRGAGYIECHHRVPLSVTGPTTTRTGDLALLCSNCHRMAHRSPWVGVEALRETVNSYRPGS
jgi:5-methylcytosine-specific restriction protein A